MLECGWVDVVQEWCIGVVGGDGVVEIEQGQVYGVWLFMMGMCSICDGDWVCGYVLILLLCVGYWGVVVFCLKRFVLIYLVYWLWCKQFICLVRFLIIYFCMGWGDVWLIVF